MQFITYIRLLIIKEYSNCFTFFSLFLDRFTLISIGILTVILIVIMTINVYMKFIINTGEYVSK